MYVKFNSLSKKKIFDDSKGVKSSILKIVKKIKSVLFNKFYN